MMRLLARLGPTRRTVPLMRRSRHLNAVPAAILNAGGLGGRLWRVDRNRARGSKRKTVLRLPDLEQSKNVVLNSLPAASSQESYGHAIDEFIGCYCSEPRLAFSSPKHRALSRVQAEAPARR